MGAVIGRRACFAMTVAVSGAGAAVPPLAAAFQRIEASIGGRLGVAVRDPGGGLTAAHRAGERFPMASTFKALLVGATLARVDAGTERLDRRVRIPATTLAWSPVTAPRAGQEITVGELAGAVTAISDNTAANLLLDALGGPPALTAWLRSIGDGVTRLDRTEPALNEALPGDPRDTTTPAAMLASLEAMTLGPALSAPSRARLRDWLRGNTTGGTRLRAGVPPGWEVADRTGTAAHGTSNVVGLLWPPGASAPLVVAAFITECPADGARRDAALAAVATAIAATWDAART